MDVIEYLRAVLFEGFLLVDTGRIEVFPIHRCGIVTDWLTEDVFEMCSRIGRDDERLVAGFREFRCRRRGDGAFADAALSREKQISGALVGLELFGDRFGV